jgi:tetratricopeptide (TPR) repeat protein
MVKSKAKKSEVKKQSSSRSEADDAAQLAEDAQALMDRFDVHEAMKLYRRALHLEPDNAALLEAFGEACLQMGQRDEACEAFGRSVELQPDGGAHRYMYLGQLRSGAEAVESFARGVAILRSERAAVEQRSGSREELQQAWVEATHALVSGLCSTAEIYLTDACDEPNAEESCEALAMEALSLVESLEVQTLAEPFVTAVRRRLPRRALASRATGASHGVCCATKAAPPAAACCSSYVLVSSAGQPAIESAAER